MTKRKPQYYLFKIYELLIINFWNILSQIKFRYWGVKIGKNVKLYGVFSLVNMNKISIGNGTRINSGYRNFVGKFNRVCLWTGQNGEIKIGDHVGISNATIVAEELITIESKVYVGGGTQIYDNDFHPLKEKDRDSNPNKIPSSPILIKSGVFIGAHCIILKGTSIGENSVIGAGSVVTGIIPPNEIWGGVPAKKLRDL